MAAAGPSFGLAVPGPVCGVCLKKVLLRPFKDGKIKLVTGRREASPAFTVVSTTVSEVGRIFPPTCEFFPSLRPRVSTKFLWLVLAYSLNFRGLPTKGLSLNLLFLCG